jgi:DNA repair exonuclease SbcCD ATPase subunit
MRSPITFKRLQLRHVGSWAACDIPLDAQGMIGIVGETGVGKSTIFKALHWCLYGEMPDPIQADEICPPGKPSSVRLVMEQDGHRYVVTRHRKHPTYGSKVFFEGYGIPATVGDSHVKTVQGLIQRFIGVSSTLFRTTTYFSQRNFHQFHTMTDQAKKAYIESITYGSMFERCEALTRDRLHDYERELAYIEGERATLTSTIAVMKVQLAEQRDVTQSMLEQIDSVIDAHMDRIQTCREQQKRYRHARAQQEKLEDALRVLQNQRAQALADVERYSHPDQRCPRCGLVMVEALRKERLVDAQHMLRKVEQEVQSCEKKYAPVRENVRHYGELDEAMCAAEHECTVLQRERATLEQTRTQHLDIVPFEQTLALRETEALTLQKPLRYHTFWLKGFGFQGLRSYMLTHAIAYMTARIQCYLYRAFGDAMAFDLRLEKNRLVTLCNGRSYWTLSGGERQSVDLCTGLALRDLAERYNKARFNLLILDEPFENLDSRLTTIAQDLVLSYAKPSTFLITQRRLSVPLDAIYAVTKTDNISAFTLQRG